MVTALMEKSHFTANLILVLNEIVLVKITFIRHLSIYVFSVATLWSLITTKVFFKIQAKSAVLYLFFIS